MILLGVLLVLAAAGVIGAVVIGATETTTAVTVFDRTVEISTTELFLAGAGSAAALLIGLALMTSGSRRSSRIRRERRELRRENQRLAQASPPAAPSPPAPRDRLVARGAQERPEDSRSRL